MSKFNAIEIARLVALHPKVDERRFMGLFERVVYVPTRSRIDSYRNYYGQHEADVLLNIAEAEDPRPFLGQAKEIHIDPQGRYRLDLCISADCCFAAFQVFEQRNGTFEPYSKLRFLEGEDARVFENLLA